MTVLAANPEPPTGLAHLVAVAVVVLLFWAGTAMHRRYLTLKGGANHSPTADLPAVEGVKPQVIAGSDTAVTPVGEGGAKGKAVERWFAANGTEHATNAAVADARSTFRVSRATVMRAARKVRKSRKGEAK